MKEGLPATSAPEAEMGVMWQFTNLDDISAAMAMIKCNSTRASSHDAYSRFSIQRSGRIL